TGALALLLGLLGWAGAGLRGPAARGQDQPKELSAKERKELEQQAADLFRQGVEHYRNGRLDDAVRTQERCLSLHRKLYPEATFPDGHADLAKSLNALGFLLQTRGEYAQAEPYYRDALAMYRQLYPQARFKDGHPHLATSLNNLGVLLR